MNAIDIENVIKLIKEGATILDNRSNHYYNWEHIENSINIHWSDIEKNIGKVVKDKNQKIITSCQSFLCDASQKAYKKLKELGYKNIFEYSGGLVDWKNNDFPISFSKEFKLAPNIYKFPKQVFYGLPVGSYLIEEDDFILLVDGPHDLNTLLEDFIASFNKEIIIFMTHDSTAGASKVLQEKYNAKIYLHKDDRDGEWLTVQPDYLIDENHQFSKNLVVIHTPGHSSGSSCLLDKKNNVLFSGDHVFAINNSFRDFIKKKEAHDMDSELRFKSCQKLLSYNFDVAYPFHYEPLLDAKQKIKNFISIYN
jgi:glyoxylase-like metal-dependent hydrolase (beta-lactamase superfamily II)/rhodanese-related sulfurtransferase